MISDEMQDPRDAETTVDPLNRREFLKVLGPGVYIFFCLEDLLAFPQGRGGGSSYPEDFNAYLKIDADGRVTCFSGKIEMGQGIIAALAQMLAEELEVSYDSITMIMGDTRLCPPDGGTNGSRSVRYFGPALRAAGAEAREVLLQLAAENLQLPVERLAAKNGVVSDKTNAAKKVSYGALAQGKRIERHLAKKPDLKPPSAFQVCGKSLPRPDRTEKVTGKAKFAGDIRLPGMLYGRVLRPPAHGARLKSVDASAVKEIKDARVLQEGDFVAVVHELPDLAAAAIERIKAQYDMPDAKIDEKTIFQHLQEVAAPQGNVIRERGDQAKGRELATTRFEETYLTPYVAHVPTETHTALADVKEDGATVWIGTQRPFGAPAEIAQALKMPADKVWVITPYVGGGFGGKSQVMQAVQAARLSKMTGKPVQVAWTREEEFFYDTFMPAAVVKISSGLNAANQIVFWDYQVLFAGERSSEPLYEIPHQRTVSRGAVRGGPAAHPFGTGAWRGPGSNTNIFARESHIDIMAAKAGLDPVQFRLKNLNPADDIQKRVIRVLNAAAEKFGWKPAKTPSGRGHGVVCLDYLETCVAAMAEISVTKDTGRIQVNRIVLAQDMGPVINPEGATMQIEGGVTMGLGYCLSEEIHFKGGEIKDLNYNTYEIPRFSWTPKIEVVLVTNHEIQPRGCGEPPITCMGGLMANALFDATGVRLNRLPLTPERIKEKL
ncbi:MAG: molybdopterin-dependent oxidoreductase [Acidobacteriia bacterium]|nr:molybdopterin-dependent oxidoreductase [Terriglobia bacterium]